MLPLFGRAAADSRRRWAGRSDRVLPEDGSWTRTPEALAHAHREEVSNTPAESLKPDETSPPKVEAKLGLILLCVPVCAVAVLSAAARICDWLVAPHRNGTDHLRVLIANERKDRLELVVPIVAALGHEVIAREIEVEDVGAVTARERPDVALVGLGASSQHALDLIDKIVREAACPVNRPAPRARPRVHQGSLQTRRVRPHLRRRCRGPAELDRHRPDAASRNTTIYRAHSAGARRSNARTAPDGTPLHRRERCLRDAARTLTHRQRKLIDLAAAVVDGHRLLPKQPQAPLPS